MPDRQLMRKIKEELEPSKAETEELHRETERESHWDREYRKQYWREVEKDAREEAEREQNRFEDEHESDGSMYDLVAEMDAEEVRGRQLERRSLERLPDDYAAWPKKIPQESEAVLFLFKFYKPPKPL